MMNTIKDSLKAALDLMLSKAFALFGRQEAAHDVVTSKKGRQDTARESNFFRKKLRSGPAGSQRTETRIFNHPRR